MLNKDQSKAAQFLHGTCAVIAVPGSGKTKCMMQRIAMLVNDHHIAPESILGLTFTRNAAEEMRNRLKPLLGNVAHRVTLLTIHSFCHYLLRNEGHVFEILYGKEQIILLRDVIKKLRYKDLAPGMLLREISLAKNNLISSEEMKLMYEGDPTMVKVAHVYDLYDREKKKRMLMDFDDLLTEVYNLLQTNEDIRERYSSTFLHIMIDEFQDTNPAQMEIVKLLKGEDQEGASLFVVGDDWQSIYAFTGASVGNIINFKSIFPESTEYILNLNYRSTPQILKACQNLINHNTRKIEKTLVTENENGEEPIILESSSEENEALTLVTEITDLTHRGYAFKDITVLYRANFQSRVIEETFSQYKIPYHIENGLNFYNRAEVRVLLDYLRLIHDPHAGDEALLSIINVPNRYIGKTFTRELESYAATRNIPLYEALKSMIIPLPYIRKNVKDLIQFLDPLIQEKMEPAELIALLRTSLDYDRYITDDDVPSPDDVKIGNLNQLQLSAARYSSIESFLIYTDTFQDESVNDKDGVSLMTIHKSKGLEFPVVFLTGLIDGIMPTKKGDTEEERRICFVAISRAMKLLYLSYSLTYLGQASARSPFVDEILGIKQ
jgi:DNA helicase-2/ATP-dependent DNA helicase PcrA